MSKTITLLTICAIVLIGIVPTALSANITVGVKRGDWIEYDSVFTGTPPSSPHSTGFKIEVLSVKGTNVTAKSISIFSDGTQTNSTVIVNIETGGIGLFIIPANLSNGDEFYDKDIDVHISITGVKERSYAGGRRIVMFAFISKTNAIWYWDKTTGVLVEASLSKDKYTQRVKVAKTNIWQSELFALPIDQTVSYLLIILATVTVISGALLVRSRRNKSINKATL